MALLQGAWEQFESKPPVFVLCRHRVRRQQKGRVPEASAGAEPCQGVTAGSERELGAGLGVRSGIAPRRRERGKARDAHPESASPERPVSELSLGLSARPAGLRGPGFPRSTRTEARCWLEVLERSQ